jgi:hypothetical protein
MVTKKKTKKVSKPEINQEEAMPIAAEPQPICNCKYCKKQIEKGDECSSCWLDKEKKTWGKRGI